MKLIIKYHVTKKRKERMYDGVKCLYYNMHHLTTGTGINNTI